MLSDYIDDLIEQAKDLPNSEHKNRMVSHLKDALAHAKVMEFELSPTVKPEASGGCTCPMPGVVAANCPIHKA